MRFDHVEVAKWGASASKGSKKSKADPTSKSPLLVVLTEKEWQSGAWLKQVPAGLRERVSNAKARAKDPLKAGSRLCVPATDTGEDAWIALVPKETDTFFLLEFARDSVKAVLHPSHASLAIAFPGGNSSEMDLHERLADAFGAAVAARIFLMPVFGKRAKDQKPWKLGSIEIISDRFEDLESFCYGYASGEGTNIARFLATLPPNVLDPAEYGRRIREICRKNGLSFKFHSNRDLKRMGAGAFTAVDQGNPHSEGGIYELGYAPKGARSRATIHLAGKGMCFDTGGYDVKINGGMMTMKGDMQGSAVALGTLVTAARLGLPYRMKAFLAVTENHLSPKAYKADEVITALNGLTIEVINTDAEGRMVLADTLTLASREKPDCVIDFATLTGSAVRAIGTRYAAVFTNREELHEPIRAAGRRSGERTWTFPIDSVYARGLESKIADTLQCLKGSGPDHILASCFLSKFVEDGVPWVHVDLSPSENEGGIGHVDSMFTGFGVRWALEFIQRN